MPLHRWFRSLQWRLACLIILISIIIVALLLITRTTPQQQAAKERRWQVHAWRIMPKTYTPNVILYGIVESPQATAIEAAIHATVERVWVRDGDHVAQGDKLVSLDPREAEYALQTRQADVDELAAQIKAELAQHQNDQKALENEKKLVALLKNDVTRQQELKDRQVGSSASLENAVEQLEKQKLQLLQRELALTNHENRLSQLRAKYNHATARLAQAQLDLERANIVAPFAGRVTQLHVVRGNRVQPGEAVVELYDVGDIEVRAPVPTYYLAAIRAALTQNQRLIATANVDGHTIALQLMRLAGQVHQGRSGVDALLSLVDTQLALTLGRSLEVKLNLPPQVDVYLLPEEALYTNDTVYIIDNQRLRRAMVTRVGQITYKNYTYALVRSPELKPQAVVMTTHLPNARNGLWVVPNIAKAVTLE